MSVLVMCECSQVVTAAFRSLGVEAYSCDLQSCYGILPQYHLQMDCFEAFDLVRPSLVVAHPPCTYLSKAGARWMFKGGVIDPKRYEKMLLAAQFFNKIYHLPVDHLVIENPVMLRIAAELVPPFSQEIEPYMFGDPYTKKTRLYIRGLPLLLPTNIVAPIRSWCPSNCSANRGTSKNVGTVHDVNLRSRTFDGIGNALAAQYSSYV